MVDRLFTDPDLAALYDLFSPFEGRGDFSFYLPMVMEAGAVLDVGCGTGALLHKAREEGHTGRLCGLDPAFGMIEQARKRLTEPVIEWTLGDMFSTAWDQEFDLVIMTGHAFQVFLEDDEIRASLAAVRSALSRSGKFVFETRNPLAREWERWHELYSGSVTDASGTVVSALCEVDAPVTGGLVRFSHTFTSPSWAEAKVSLSTLRFLDPETLAARLIETGFVIEAQLGDWDRRILSDASPEIITAASRAEP